MFEKVVFPVIALIIGIYTGVVFSVDTTVGQVDPINRVIHEGDLIQIVPDGRVITFIYEGDVYTASYDKGSELLVGEKYFLAEGGDLFLDKYREKE